MIISFIFHKNVKNYVIAYAKHYAYIVLYHIYNIRMEQVSLAHFP